jgi:GT2 family glycosyltransferase
VATYDRPDDLRQCLQGLLAQISTRSVEIIVIDNHPASGKTPPVVAAFPGVRLVSEARQGVAYARNAGVAASRGEIVVTVDDDVTAPPDWLERLLCPFVRSDVLAVTGNVLPLDLATRAQQIFEIYGGLGRGYYRFEVDRDWFEQSWKRAVSTWLLGGTANSAYRARIFADPAIGLMDEALGPGMPSGVGEDIYLFYKVLKAGGTIHYEPTAYVWHRHRREFPALRRQLYNYSKGFVSYHLTTLFNDRDYRALHALFVVLPVHRLKQIWRWCRGDRTYPASLIAAEIRGNLMGAWSLWRSHRIVRRQGRSAPYDPNQNLGARSPRRQGRPVDPPRGREHEHAGQDAAYASRAGSTPQ